jgi:cell division protein FtsI/penicillin-binding protein 2
MLYDNNKRLMLMFKAIISVLIVLTIRVAYVTTIWSGELSVITDKQYTISESISNIKYSLQDTNGKELLSYFQRYYFVVDLGSFTKNNRETDLSALKTIIYILRNYNKEYDLTNLGNGKSQKIYYEVDEETYNKLKEIKGVKGVYAFKKSEVDRKSTWKVENMISNQLDKDNKMKSEGSIERYIYDRTKDNEFPKIIFDRSVSGEIEEKEYKVAEDNISVRLTLDKAVQEDIKEILLEDKYKKYDQIGVVLAESSTGKIKAMVQRDDWKPNINLCSATENGYEPGSIFKTITQEATMELEKVSMSQRFLCTEEGKSHGNVNMEEAYVTSCNDYFRKLGIRTKFDNILPFAKKQGLFNKVLNFDGNGEVTGDFSSEEYQDANLAIGQSMRITPVQAVGIVNTIVNQGAYVKPYLLDSFVDLEDKAVETFASLKQKVIERSTARIIKNQMLDVVQSPKGTGKYAYIPGVEIGGKTGTTQRYVTVENEDKTDINQKYTIEKHSDGWFIGFFRYNNRYYSMAVFVKDIDTEYEDAGVTAAPIFKEIVRKVYQNKSL